MLPQGAGRAGARPVWGRGAAHRQTPARGGCAWTPEKRSPGWLGRGARSTARPARRGAGRAGGGAAGRSARGGRGQASGAQRAPALPCPALPCPPRGSASLLHGAPAAPGVSYPVRQTPPRPSRALHTHPCSPTGKPRSEAQDGLSQTLWPAGPPQPASLTPALPALSPHSLQRSSGPKLQLASSPPVRPRARRGGQLCCCSGHSPVQTRRASALTSPLSCGFRAPSGQPQQRRLPSLPLRLQSASLSADQTRPELGPPPPAAPSPGPAVTRAQLGTLGQTGCVTDAGAADQAPLQVPGGPSHTALGLCTTWTQTEILGSPLPVTARGDAIRRWDKTVCRAGDNRAGSQAVCVTSAQSMQTSVPAGTVCTERSGEGAHTLHAAPQPLGPQRAQVLGTPGAMSGLTLHFSSHIPETDVISLFAAGKYQLYKLCFATY